MIPKPEILKGEVKEFIELLQLWQGNKDLTIEDFWGKCYGISEFYSQPFQPEMITEYFEGWEETTERTELDEVLYETDENYITIPKDVSGKINFGLLDGGYEFLADYFYPATLSQFITNCIQANIKLIWKEKV